MSACGVNCTDFKDWIGVKRAFFSQSHLINIAIKFGEHTDHGVLCCACSECNEEYIQLWS